MDWLVAPARREFRRLWRSLRAGNILLAQWTGHLSIVSVSTEIRFLLNAEARRRIGNVSIRTSTTCRRIA